MRNAIEPAIECMVAHKYDEALAHLQSARAGLNELIAAARNHLNVIGCGTALDCDCCNRLRDAIASVEGEP